MIQQLKFSPVENVLAVLFVVVILGYLLYLLDRSLQHKQRGKHTVSRATVVSKEQSTAVGQPVYLADGMVNSGITETENVKSVIFENLEKPGERITLEVSNRIYRELQEGDSGSLSYRGDKLVSFGALQNRDDRERSFRR